MMMNNPFEKHYIDLRTLSKKQKDKLKKYIKRTDIIKID
jgi:hypothetical protein